MGAWGPSGYSGMSNVIVRRWACVCERRTDGRSGVLCGRRSRARLGVGVWLQPSRRTVHLSARMPDTTDRRGSRPAAAGAGAPGPLGVTPVVRSRPDRPARRPTCLTALVVGGRSHGDSAVAATARAPRDRRPPRAPPPRTHGTRGPKRGSRRAGGQHASFAGVDDPGREGTGWWAPPDGWDRSSGRPPRCDHLPKSLGIRVATDPGREHHLRTVKGQPRCDPRPQVIAARAQWPFVLSPWTRSVPSYPRSSSVSDVMSQVTACWPSGRGLPGRRRRGRAGPRDRRRRGVALLLQRFGGDGCFLGGLFEGEDLVNVRAPRRAHTARWPAVLSAVETVTRMSHEGWARDSSDGPRADSVVGPAGHP